jgi:uncharacterized protein (TIGR03118 family)
MQIHSRWKYAGAPIMLGLASVFAFSVQGAMAQNLQHYTQTNLISNQASLAPNPPDPNLVNSWGLTRSSTSPWWVADNGTGLSTLYSGAGAIVPLVVTVPPNPDTPGATGTPTGVVFNGSNGFQIAPGFPAAFIFVTEDGTISGWNPKVKPTEAVIVPTGKKDAVYKGATIATAETGNGSESFFYAADFHHGKVAVFDSTFQPVFLGGDAFNDDRLPHGFAPFNVQNIGGNIYVAYAKQGKGRHDEVDGAGLGYVDVYSPLGRLLLRLESGPWFNAPWGLTMASSDFGAFTHDVLVGQFGSGQILAFNPVSGKFEGALNDSTNAPITIDGLWALSFGNDASAGPATTLFFTAGPSGETNGLFGTLTAVENIQGSAQ